MSKSFFLSFFLSRMSKYFFLSFFLSLKSKSFLLSSVFNFFFNLSLYFFPTRQHLSPKQVNTYALSNTSNSHSFCLFLLILIQQILSFSNEPSPSIERIKEKQSHHKFRTRIHRFHTHIYMLFTMSSILVLIIGHYFSHFVNVWTHFSPSLTSEFLWSLRVSSRLSINVIIYSVQF